MKTISLISTFLFISLLTSCGVVKEKNDCMVEGCGGTVNPGSNTSVTIPGVSSPASNPYYSNESSITISGSCVNGATVTLAGADSQSMICSGSLYTFIVAPASDGSLTFQITQTVSGSTSSPKSLVWNRDITEPSAPSITSPASSIYSSTSKSLTVSGDCEVGSVVTISGDSSETYNCGSGTFIFNLSQSSNGTYNYSLSQTDPSGNASSPTTFQWIISETVIASPTITSPETSPYNTSGSSITISGTCIDGATVNLSGSDTQTTTCSSSSYSFSISSSSDGAKTYNVTQTVSGTTSSSVSTVWNRDTTDPSAPTITSPASNPYNSTSKSVTLSGACETGASVALSGASSATYNCSGGTYSFSLSKASIGTYDYSIAQTDQVGNTSSSTSFQWVISDIVVATPTISTPSSSPYYTSGNSITISGTCTDGSTVNLGGSDTQTTTCSSSSYSFSISSSSDGAKTYTVTQTVSGTTSSSVSTVWNRDTANPSAPTITSPATNPYNSTAKSVTLSGACETGASVALSGASSASYNCSAGTYSFALSKASIGTYDYSIAQTDLAGNTSSSTSFQWVISSEVIAAPTITSPETSPYYSSGSSITISGTCIDGSTVNLGGSDTQTTTCSSSSYSFSISSSSDGAKTYTVTQTVSGTTSSSVSTVWNRDTTNPSAPTITSPSTNPYLSSSKSLTLSGACEVGASVEISGAGSGTYDCVSGTYSFAITKTSDGTYNYSISQTDIAGNTSSSTSFQWEINSSNPVPTITTPLASPYYSNGSSLSIAGTCASSAHTVYLFGLASTSTACSAGLTYSFNPSCSTPDSTCYNDGTYIYSVAQSAGTLSDSVSKVWVRDTLAPNPVVFTKSNPFVSGDSSLAITGTCEEGTTVSIATNAAINSTCTNGIFTLNISSSCSTSCDYAVKQTDKAGNSSPSTTFTWIYESTMPATPTITSPTSLITYNTASSFDITGTCSGSNNVILSGVNTVLATAITGADVTGGSLTKICSSGVFAFTINLSADGNYNFSIIQQIPETASTAAIDSSPVGRTWVRDTSTPVAVTIVNPTAPYSSVSPYTAGGDFYISGTCEEYATVTISGSSSATTTCSNGVFSFIVSQNTDLTTYSYSIIQTDRASNSSVATTLYWSKDNSIPEAPRILNPSLSPYKYNGDSIIISGSCTTGLTVNLSNSDSQSMTCANGAFSFTSNKSADGTYLYYVSQGTSPSVSPNSAVTWMRDVTGPTVTIGGSIAEGSTNDNYSASFTLSASETVNSYYCSLDSAAYSPCVSPLTFDGLANTTHSLSVKAIDLAGNWGSVTTRNWTQLSYNTIALYHFENASNSSSYGSTNNFTASSVTYPAGKISNALSYVSANASRSVSLSHNSTLAKLNSKMTVELWFNSAVKPANNKFTPIITKMGASGAMGWEFGIKLLGSNSYIVFRGSNNGTTTQEVRSTPITIAKSTWYHIAATYDKGTVRFYLNGTAQGSGSVSGSVAADLFNNSSTAMKIGESVSTTEKFDGLVDEVRLSQIIRYSGNFTAPTSALSSD